MSDDPILKVSNIESYYGPIMAIRGVSLAVPRGKIITVLSLAGGIVGLASGRFSLGQVAIPVGVGVGAGTGVPIVTAAVTATI